MKNGFSSYHPFVNFIYFLAVLLSAFFFMHPVCLVISFLCAFFYALRLKGVKALKFFLFALLPMMLLTAIINPAFNHQGVTILTYLPSENPLTLESICYGAAVALMLGGVILWFSAFNEVMSSDKFIYLFGKIVPSLSLLLSMVLRFVPKFKEEIREVSFGQKCIGKSTDDGSVIQRIRAGLSVLSIMITRSMEQAIITADSMKSRGFGQGRRTAFSNYTFEKRDKVALSVILILSVYVFTGAALGCFEILYVPIFKVAPISVYSVSVFAAYLALGLLPLILEWKEERKWNASR